MKTKIIAFILIAVGSISLPLYSMAQEDETEQIIQTDQYYRGTVIEISQDAKEIGQGLKQNIQMVKVRLDSGEKKGEEINIEHGRMFDLNESQQVSVGQQVVIIQTQTPQGEMYFIADKYRIPWLVLIFAIFALLVIILGRLKGLGALVGMAISVLALSMYIVPQILDGKNPLIVSSFGAAGVAIITIYLAHGFKKRATVALLSTLITLAIAIGLSVVFVNLTQLGGLGSEEAYFVNAIGANIDLRGLLLAGIIIGVLGVLDDITVSQSAAVDEISRANPKLSSRELYKRGLSIGKEHVSSLVNTLVFAYVGASFPLLLLFTMSKTVPAWITLNSELLSEEIVRTLVGSTALVLAVPITTLLAAYLLKQKNEPEKEVESDDNDANIKNN